MGQDQQRALLVQRPDIDQPLSRFQAANPLARRRQYAEPLSSPQQVLQDRPRVLADARAQHVLQAVQDKQEISVTQQASKLFYGLHGILLKEPGDHRQKTLRPLSVG